MRACPLPREGAIQTNPTTWLCLALALSLAIAPAAAEVTGPELVLELPWGDGDAEVGRRGGDESSPVGPMSFAVGPDGFIHVLDQVNYRVLRFDPAGQLDLEMTLPATTFQDVAVAPDGALLVVDRLVRSSILVLDEAGGTVGEYGVLSEAIPEGGGISATFVLDDGVWLEWAHTYTVRVLDEQLLPCEPTVAAGRVLRGGEARVRAALDGWGGADVWLEEMETTRTVADLHLDPADRIDRIIWIEADDEGRVVVALHLWARTGIPLLDHVEVLLLGADLTVQETFRSPHVIVEWEQFREFKLTPDGDLYQMAFTDRGMKLLRWRLR